MKKLYLFLLVGLFSINLLAQPTRNWVSYYAGDYTRITNICYDKTNNYIYIAGETGDSTGIATPGTYIDIFLPDYIYNNVFFSKALFIAKFDIQGNRIWGTYVDTSQEYGGYRMTIKTDNSGNLYLATYAPSGLGSSNAAIPNAKGGILYKFSPNGERLWATYLGNIDTLCYIQGNPQLGLAGNTHMLSMAIDGLNNIYITAGSSSRNGVATIDAYQDTINGMNEYVTSNPTIFDQVPIDGMLLKYDSNGVKQYGTYFGGSGVETPSGIWVSSDSSIYISGFTTSQDWFGTPGSYQNTPPIDSIPNNTPMPSFLIKFSPNGYPEWSTYIYGTDMVQAANLTGDQDGNVYISGVTSSLDSIATPNTLDTVYSGGYDLFIMKFNPFGQKIWGTYFGGTGVESFEYSGLNWINMGIHYSKNNHSLFWSGFTDQINNLVSPCSFQTQGTTRGFMAKIDTAGQLQWASHYDVGVMDLAIKDNSNGNPTDMFICGFTNINGMATPGAFKETKTTPLSGYIGRFGDYYDCSKDTLHLNWSNPWLVADSGFSNYHWYHNSIEIPNEDSNALYVTDTTGMYFVSAERCGCTYYSNRITFTDTTTQVSNINPHEATLSVFPNPAHNTLTLQLGGNQSYAQGTLQISNAIGKVLHNQAIRFDSRQQAEVSLEGLAAGFYIIKLQIGSSSYVSKVVKE